jgi:transcriptional repressor NrdR
MKYRQKIGDSRVIESRESADGVTIRRRREAPDGKRFTTYERIERPNLVVIKKDGKRELFDRSKLSTSIHRSVGKFFESDMEIEEIISSIEDAVYEIDDTEVTSRQIGDLVMDQLAQRNEVAYVRFASVYREFKTLDEFEEILKEQRHKAKREAV